MTTLHEALDAVAIQLNLDPMWLYAYAAEDTLKGFYETGNKYDIPYAADGKFLYALIRALKPNQVLEIGTRFGGSARHILEALERDKNDGYLVTLDIDENATIQSIPKRFREQCTFLNRDAEQWIKDYIAIPNIQGFDFIHEDGSHSTHLVHAIYDMLPSLMPRGGVIVSHDVGTGVGSDIMQGIKNAGFEPPPTYVYDGSPCGFSVMKYEGNKHE